MSFNDLQEKAIDIEIDLLKKRDWLKVEHKEITSDPPMIFLRLDFGDSSFKTADVSWLKRIAKKYNCRVKFLAFHNKDHLSVDLYFYPKEG
jgi:hypothetical protein